MGLNGLDLLATLKQSKLYHQFTKHQEYITKQFTQ